MRTTTKMRHIFFKVFVEKMLKKTIGFVQIDAWKFPCCFCLAFLQLGKTLLSFEKVTVHRVW